MQEKSLTDPIDLFVGMRLRARRNVLGLSQQDVGDCLGISFQQIQKYERGLNRIGASTLKKLAVFLETTVSYFFDESESATALTITIP